MERDKYKLTDEQKIIFEQYKGAVKYCIYKNFVGLAKQCDILDVYNAGYLGLAYAIKSYNEDCNCKFLSWAIRNINYSILNFAREARKMKEKKLGTISIESMARLENTGRRSCDCAFTILADYTEPYEEDLNTEQVLALLNKIAKEKLTQKAYAVYEKLYLEGKSPTNVAIELQISRTRVYQVEKRIVLVLTRACKERGVI